MRDPNRIKPFCNVLAACWLQFPDQRFGQLIANVCGDEDPYYWEEDRWMSAFAKLLRQDVVDEGIQNSWLEEDGIK